jgi:hypothetical protein
MKAGSAVSIWFFIGISLLFNGALILGTGLYELVHPPEYRVVLYELHANLWWGGLLFLAGIIYCYRFTPGKVRDSSAPDAKDREIQIR